MFFNTKSFKALAVVGGLTVAAAAYAPSAQAQWNRGSDCSTGGYGYGYGSGYGYGNTNYGYERRGMDRLAIYAPSTKIYAGDTIRLKAVAIGNQGYKLEVTPNWYSSHGGQINNKGEFCAHSPGYYTVTAKFYNRRQGRWYVQKQNIQVVSKNHHHGHRRVSHVEITPHVRSLRVNETVNLDLVAHTRHGDSFKVKARWSTSHGASISRRGEFSASRSGTYQVYASYFCDHRRQWIQATTSIYVKGYHNHDWKRDRDYNNDWNRHHDKDKYGKDWNHHNKNKHYAKVDFTRWETGKGNFFEPWAKIEGKVFSKEAHKVVLYCITSNGHWRELKSQHVSHGGTFSLHNRYSALNTKGIGIRVYCKHGRVLREVYR